MLQLHCLRGAVSAEDTSAITTVMLSVRQSERSSTPLTQIAVDPLGGRQRRDHAAGHSMIRWWKAYAVPESVVQVDQIARRECG